MSTIFEPNTKYMQIHWMELETAMRMLASPEKLHRVDDIVQTVQTLERKSGPEKAVFHLVAAIAWVTDSEAGSYDG